MFIVWSIASFFAFIAILAIIVRSRFSLFTINAGDSKESGVYIGLLYDLIGFGLTHAGSRKTIRLSFLKWTLLTKDLSKSSGPKKTSKVELTGSKSKIWNRLTGIDLGEIKARLAKLISGLTEPNLDADITVGLGDPMRTGILMGIYSILTGIAPSIGHGVSIKPVFYGSQLDWRVRFSAHFIPLRTMWHGLQLWRGFKNQKN